MKNLIFILFSFIVFSANAQEIDVDVLNYQFDDRALTEPMMDSVGHSSSELWSRTYIVYAELPMYGQGRYIIEHTCRQINDLNAVERYNKLYVPTYNGQLPLSVKTRVIREGKVVSSADNANIKTVKEEDTEYKLIAVESLLPGSFIETFTVIKTDISFSGYTTFQSADPIKELLVVIETPSFIHMKTKVVNGDVKVKEKIQGESEFKYIELKDVPAAQEEEYSFRQARMMRLEYTLDKIDNQRGGDRWGDIGSRIYTSIWADYDKYKSAAKKFVKSVGVKSSNSIQENVFLIENNLKSNVQVIRGVPTPEDPFDAIKSKFASPFGMNRMMLYALKAAEIDLQLLLTCDRTIRFFDKNFTSEEYVTDLLIYVPQIKQIIDPLEQGLRSPSIGDAYLGQDALLVKEEELGGNITPVTVTMKIPANDYATAIISENYEVSIDPDKGEFDMKVEKGWGPSCDRGLRYIFTLVNEDSKPELYKSILQTKLSDAKLTETEDVNAQYKEFSDINKPFIIKGRLTGSDMLEFTGDKIIVNAGFIIGEQSQLYNAKPRMFPMDIEFVHAYDRLIKINIPEGYSFENLDAFNKSFEYKNEKGEVLCSFISSYKIEGNQVVVTIAETYNQLTYPLEFYDSFAKVVNAAADFNKIAIFLVKK